MILSYTMSDLEKLSGVTRRTIGDYIAKGLLAGPSHRGRGASYPQADVDALLVMPRLRTLMKKEFPNLRAVINFLKGVSSYELHELAKKTSEDSFVLAVRRLRLRSALAAVLPQVSPEKLSSVLETLTPEQIRNVDTGRYQLGAVIDMAALLNGQNELASNEQNAGSGRSQSEWNISLHDGAPGAPESIAGITPGHEQTPRQPARNNGNHLIAAGEPAATKKATPDKLEDIARRVEKLEALLAID
jgi:DNA-binding transcriptional MerR regulator